MAIRSSAHNLETQLVSLIEKSAYTKLLELYDAYEAGTLAGSESSGSSGIIWEDNMLDASGVVASAAIAAGWIHYTSPYQAMDNTIVSNTITHNQETYFYFDVDVSENDRYLDFYCSVSSELDGDFLDVFIGDEITAFNKPTTPIFSESGENVRMYTLIVPAGETRVWVVYSKNSSGTSGMDGAAIHYVRFREKERQPLYFGSMFAADISSLKGLISGDYYYDLDTYNFKMYSSILSKWSNLGGDVTPDNIVGTIDTALGSSDWQSGGGSGNNLSTPLIDIDFTKGVEYCPYVESPAVTMDTLFDFYYVDRSKKLSPIEDFRFVGSKGYPCATVTTAWHTVLFNPSNITTETNATVETITGLSIDRLGGIEGVRYTLTSDTDNSIEFIQPAMSNGNGITFVAKANASTTLELSCRYSESATTIYTYTIELSGEGSITSSVEDTIYPLAITALYDGWYMVSISVQSFLNPRYLVIKGVTTGDSYDIACMRNYVYGSSPGVGIAANAKAEYTGSSYKYKYIAPRLATEDYLPPIGTDITFVANYIYHPNLLNSAFSRDKAGFFRLTFPYGTGSSTTSLYAMVYSTTSIRFYWGGTYYVSITVPELVDGDPINIGFSYDSTNKIYYFSVNGLSTVRTLSSSYVPLAGGEYTLWYLGNTYSPISGVLKVNKAKVFKGLTTTEGLKALTEI